LAPTFISFSIVLYMAVDFTISAIASLSAFFIALAQVCLLIAIVCLLHRLFFQQDRSCIGCTNYLMVLLALGSLFNIVTYAGLSSYMTDSGSAVSAFVIGSSVLNIISVIMYAAVQGDYGQPQPLLLVSQPNVYTQPGTQYPPPAYGPYYATPPQGYVMPPQYPSQGYAAPPEYVSEGRHEMPTGGPPMYATSQGRPLQPVQPQPPAGEGTG
jgi:hypothetical protein